MNISIQEEFDTNNVEWSVWKCGRFIRFIQQNPKVNQIEKDPMDEHKFLPKYLELVIAQDKEYYIWETKSLDDMLIAIFRFLQKYYPHQLILSAIHQEKIEEWEKELPKYISDENTSTKEAKLQDKLIKEINIKWLPGFKYLYEFEYQRGNDRGDLIFANDYGILVVIETKILGYVLPQIVKNLNKVKEHRTPRFIRTNQLGKCYQNWFCIPKDEEKTFHWYKKAATAGNSEGRTIYVGAIKMALVF
ncbi:9100_t:CDS:2 [Acaulospora colombiana]|uniref:9100_t:CDS:1 n=1 Tax=Acaulospora colombiana TaxID=27376 RepID=A0ACA9L1M2_9GLOM|nr:9100_t:CDS:2 [Acaulospora colombiana]